MSSNKTTADSIIVRFGDPILEEGHTAVPNLVLNYYSKLGITPAEMLFIIHVWQFWWTEKNPYPAITTIAKRMDMVKRQVQKYAKSLKEKEYLEDADIRLLRVNDRYLDGRGQVSSEYDFSGLLKAINLLHQGSPLTLKTPRKNKSVQGVNDRSRGEGANDYSPHRMNYSSPEEDTYTKKDEVNSNIRKRSHADFPVGNSATQAATPHRNGSVEGGPQGPTTNDATSVDLADVGERPVSEWGMQAIGEILKKKKGRPTKQESEERAMILAFIRDFAREFHDQAQLKSSVSRAFNIYKESGLSPVIFQDRLYQARLVTKDYQSRSRIKGSVMAYYFSVLEDQAGLKDDSHQPSMQPR